MKFFFALIGAVFGQLYTNHLNDANGLFEGLSLPGKFKLFQSTISQIISDIYFLFLPPYDMVYIGSKHLSELKTRFFYLIILILIAFN